MKKISIITTFYNADKYIVPALDSIRKQKTDGFEIEYILVNDKSPDKSLEIVEKYIKDYKLDNWKVYTPEENLGCGGARRYGIEQGTGDYFMFLDADDYYINDDFCLRAFNIMEEEKSDIIEFGMIININNGSRKEVHVPNKVIIEDKQKAIEKMFAGDAIKFNVWTKVFTKDIINTYSYSDERTFEDVRTTPIWVYNASKIIIMPSSEINYRASNNSIIRNDVLKTRLGTIKALTELCEVFKDNLEVLKGIYRRAMLDIEAIMGNRCSKDDGYVEMAEMNRKMLEYIYAF